MSSPADITLIDTEDAARRLAISRDTLDRFTATLEHALDGAASA